MKKVVLSIVGLMVLCLSWNSTAQNITNTATFTANCRSLTLGTGTTPSSTVLFTTYDGVTNAIPLNTNGLYSGELRPRAGQPGVYETDYITFTNGHAASYGSMVINLPTTDSDGNGLPDITQLNKDVNATGTGTVLQEQPNKASAPLTCTFTRTANQANGSYSIVFGSANVVGTWTHTALTGTATYIRGSTNRVTFTGTASGGTLSLTGSTPFTLNSVNQLTLPQFTMSGNDGKVYTVLTGTVLNRTVNNYAGGAGFFDFVMSTPWSDYVSWVFEINDTHDLDGNGIPDLTDAPPAYPSISAQPLDLTVDANQTAIFLVTADGTAPLKYQWRFNGTNLAGATSPSLGINNAQGTNSGIYSVFITNKFGTILSSNATLVVRTRPSITNQPQSQTIVSGSNATFTVGVSGGAPLTYQWRYNTTNIFTNVIDSALTLTNVQPTNAGNYTVVITNSLGAITSAVATLTVIIPPAITTQPTNQTVNSGSSASFVVAATGTATLKYQWQYNGSNIPNATATSYSIANIQPSQAGAYLVVITNAAGAITSSVATLTVNGPPGISSQPQSQTVLAGSPVAFNVGVGGTAPFTYQWRLNGTNIFDATSSGYAFTNAQAPNVGNYTVVITNSIGSVTSAVATLTVLFPPSITVQPQSQAVPVATSATFTVIAAGTAPLHYQWTYTGTNLPGATTSSLTIPSVQSANTSPQGYTVIITNSYGTDESQTATLTIATPHNAPGSVPAPTNMVSWWAGDGNALDTQGTNHGTLQGGVTYATGKVGQGFSLNGTTGYIQIPHSVSLSFSTQMSVVAWVKPVTLNTNRIVDKHTVGANDGYYFEANSGKLRFAITNKIVTGTTTLPLNTFSLVAGTYDGSAMKVYVNGNLENTLAATGTIPANTLPFRIGANSNGGTNFNGVIDEVMVFNRALTATEIQSINTVGASGLSKGAGFNSIVRTGGQTQLKLGGRTGAVFRIESSQDFSNWFEVITLTNSTGTINYTDASVPSYQFNFYRIAIP